MNGIKVNGNFSQVVQQVNAAMDNEDVGPDFKMFESIYKSSHLKESPGRPSPQNILYSTLKSKYWGLGEFQAACRRGYEAVADYIFNEMDRGNLEETFDDAVYDVARWCASDVE